MSQRFKERVDEVIDWLQEILNGAFIIDHLPLSFASIENAKSIAHAKAMLPLCDLISTRWCQARLLDNANPSLKAPKSDTAFLLAAGALPGLSPNFSLKTLLDAENWAPGERARLFAPIAAVLEFATHPNGLAALATDVESRPTLNVLIDGTRYLGFAVITRTISSAVDQARNVESAMEEAGGPDAELAAVVAELSCDTADEAMWEQVRVMGSAPRMELDDVNMCLSAFELVLQSRRMVMSTLCFDGGDIIRREVSQPAIKRSLEVGRLFNVVAAAVTARPAELKNLGASALSAARNLADNATANMFSKGLIAARAVVGNADVHAAYVGMAQVAKQMALAAPPSKTHDVLIWMYSSMLSLTHPPKWAGESREVVPPAAIIDALQETTEAFNCLMSRKDALRKGVDDYNSMMFLLALYYIATGDYVFFGQTSESFLSYDAKHTYYLRYARSDAAAHTTVLQAVRAALVGTATLSQPDYLQAVLAPIFMPRAPLQLASEVSVDQATVAVDAAVDLMKFAMGPTRGKMKPKHGVSVGAMFAWVCSSAFADACVMVSVACSAASTSAAEGEAKRHLERLLAAATLKFLHFVAQERDGMEGVFICGELDVAEPPPDSKQAVESWEGAIAQALHVIVVKLADQDKTLISALSGADVEGLKLLYELAASVGITGEAAERVAALAAAAAGSDPQNEAAQGKARARILAALDCAYLGCAEVRVQGAAGLKKCTGCRCVRYGSVECQKSDWKLHRTACRAIQAEGGS